MDKQQATAAIKAISAIGRLIKDAKRIPSGHLYAQLMGVLSLEKYEIIIAILVKNELIKVESHDLIWIAEDGSNKNCSKPAKKRNLASLISITYNL